MADGPRLRLARHERAAEIVARRSQGLAALRAHFADDGFLEADVPVLLPHAGQEPHLHPPRVDMTGLPGPLWLQTSPELCLKRLVCAGLPRIYALGPAFRGGREELSDEHQPEFTMLEWYEPGSQVDLAVARCRRIARAVAGGLSVEAPGDGRVLGLDEALREFAGVDLEPLLDGDRAGFVASAERAGLSLRPQDEYDALLGRVLVERVEPALRAQTQGEWIFVHGYPASQAALAQLDPADPRKALRVEAYLGGVELANGYVELADADEQRRRWEQEADQRDGPAPARDEGLLAELAEPGLPPTVGMALGVERLLMALLGATRLEDVRPFHLHLDDDA